MSAGLVLWGAQATGTAMSTEAILVGAVAAGVGSLAPDIDHPQSLIGRRIPATLVATGVMLLLIPVALQATSGGLFAAVWTELLTMSSSIVKWGILAVVVGAALLTLSGKTTAGTRHRGPVHSLAVGVVATVAVFIIGALLRCGPWIAPLFAVGWLSHLAADATTPNGLPYLLWPLGNSTGSPIGRGVPLAIMLALIASGLAGWSRVVPAWQQSATAAAPQVSRTAAAVDVTLARQRLREAAPEIESALVNAEAPVVTQDGTNTSFSWEYLQRQAPNAVAVKTITITLDNAGHIVGVDH